MVKVKLFYSDDTIVIREFKNMEEAKWFIYNEGDHLMRFSFLDD